MSVEGADHRVYCDALTLAAITDQLRADLVEGRVQEVVLVAPHVLGLEIYRDRGRHYLLMSADPQEGGRLHLVSQRLRRGVQASTPLVLRMKKLVRGGRIVGLRQPLLERVVSLDVSSGDRILTLVIEVMGRYSNVVLVGDDDAILECARRVPRRHNRYRVLLPGYAYVPPPVQDKTTLEGLTPSRLNQLLQHQPAAPLWKRLVAVGRGVSPLLAREIVFRATADSLASEADPAVLLARSHELLGLMESRHWEPSVALEEGSVVSYAPYVLTHCAEHRACSSMSEAMEQYYAAAVTTSPSASKSAHDSYAIARHRVQELVQRAVERLRHRRESLLKQQRDSAEVEGLRWKGEALLAYAHEIPIGRSEWTVQWGEDGQPLKIDLHPSLSAVDNARRYFRRYERAKSAAEEVPVFLRDLANEDAYLEQLATDLSLAEDHRGIAAVEVALAEAGYITGRKRLRTPMAGPRRYMSQEGFVVLVGRNSRQNEELTFRRAASRDVWLHVHGLPGAHVLIKAEGREVPEAVIRRGAELAAYYSAARSEARALVDYTLRRHVRRLPGGRPGQVRLRAFETMTVIPNPWAKPATTTDMREE